MPDNKKHHYVPKFYLRRFSDSGKDINIWNIPRERKILSANLKNQCYRDYFYGKDPTVEHALGQSEGQAAEIFRMIDECGAPPPPRSPCHLLLLLYVLAQYGRSAYSVDVLEDMNDQMMKRVLGRMPETRGFDLGKFNIEITEAGQYSVGLVVQSYPLALDLGCKLLINKTDCEFVASDNPVVLYNQFLKFLKFGSNTGLACKGLQIFLPIGPDKQIMFFDPEVYGVGGGARPYVEISKPRDIYELNTLQMCNASKNIYFRDRSLNIEALARKSAPFRRMRKSTVTGFPTPGSSLNRKGEFITASREDVKTNLHLSFVRITVSARRWEKELKKRRYWPATIVRNPQLCEDHREFLSLVRKGKFSSDEFFEFMEQKVGQS